MGESGNISGPAGHKHQRVRLDVLLVERGLTESREQAKRLILAGLVEVEGVNRPKPGMLLPASTSITLRATERYVSRGGIKLEAALQHFSVDLRDRVAADIGASTGGFTDCLLQHGARLVYAVDVGTSQLHQRLRNDRRVILREHVNARELIPELFDRPIDLFVVDVSFISLHKIIPSITQVVANNSQLICLVKPQFESTRLEVSKGQGIIRNPDIHRRVLHNFEAMCTSLGWSLRGLLPSPIRGGSGNIEYLSHLVRCSSLGEIDIDATVDRAFMTLSGKT